MSGGYFNYNQALIGTMADEIESIIENNNNQDIDDWGCTIGHGYKPEIIDRFRLAVDVLRETQVMAHRIDWLLSGDDGEESFLRRWHDDLEKLWGER